MSAAPFGLVGISHRLQKNGAMRMHRNLCASITHRASQIWRWGFAAALALLIGASMPVHAQSVAETAAPALKEKCLGCHDDAAMKSEEGKPMAVMADDYLRSAHRKLDCTDCHDAALSTRHPKNALGPVKPQVCQDCHADEFKAVAGSIHGRRASGDKAIKDCTSCHGSLHTVHKGGDIESPLSPVNQIKTCGECHEDILKHYERSVHAHALLKSGLTEAAPSCSSCHGKHDVLPKSEPGSRTHHANVPATCGSCHKGVLREWNESAHGTALKAGNAEGPVCSTCHESHGVELPTGADVRHQMSDGCGTCHEDVTSSFRDSFHGKATSLGNRKAAACADCHTPHRNLPASDPRSSIHPDQLAKTCGTCHSNVNAAFLSFDPHANPSDPTRNPYVHWIWLGMTSLLIGVFGFFGLHGLLWMQRALVGKLRGEFKIGHGGDGPYVRRFSSMQMGVHIAIVSSFLLLAATGLPLKFAESTWAPALMSLLGGAEVAGWLHRLAGTVTFGYFIWHLGMLVHGLFVKNERGFFWGPRSMVPQPRDLFDFIGMMKYFLYLGPRPKFDRFTYWEKFDYLAVFWGVAIIGVSGLILWFPTAATHVLPGWALNAAYVIHSDEALLATGFIFLFHFFHTHLRPEAFPMDPVIFTGCMPLERFKYERPLEYERLMAEGRLQDYLVPAPTPQRLRRAYIFGFSALTLGVLLAVFIFSALLGGLH
jgi:cytochrome b subunit of formate dehydrogenase